MFSPLLIPFRHIGTASLYLATSPAPPINAGRNRNRVDRRAHRRILASPLASSRSPTHNRNLTFSSFSSPPTTSLSTSRFCPFSAGDSVAGDFSCTKLRPDCLNPAIIYSSKGKRSVVAMVIPYSRESAWEQPPPDLASFLFKNRIVYLGMSPVPSVTELIVAKFLYLKTKS